jgi:hypothetical protein
MTDARRVRRLSLGRATIWLGSAVLVAACGAATSLDVPSGPGGAAGHAGTSTGGGGAAGSFSGLPAPKTDCVVAVHADQCCSQPVAASAAVLSADPCLVPYGLARVPSVLTGCPAAARCSSLNCTFPSPTTRIAALDPSSPGACRFADECATPTDCAVAAVLTGCCACPEVVPQKLALANPCLSPPGPPSGLACHGTCGPISCGACPSLSQPMCTGLLSPPGYLRCVDMMSMH